MNLAIYCVVATVCLPLLISGNLYLESKKFDIDKIVFKNDSDDFQTVLIDCVYQVWYNDTDFKNCATDLFDKAEITQISDPRFNCCFRVICFKCWEQMLVTKCGVSLEEVMKNDDLQFEFWNQAQHPQIQSNCNGDKVQSLTLCKLADVTVSTPPSSSSSTPSSSTPSSTTPDSISETDFLNKLYSCYNKTSNDNDYNKCLKDETSKMGLNHPYTDTKSQCCSRVANYNCMKESLTSKCDVSKVDVQKHDSVHFQYWNTASFPGVPGKCSDGAEESIKYCNGVYKVTWNIILQLAGIFTLYLLVFSKNFNYKL